MVLVVFYVRAFHGVAIPQSGLLAQVRSGYTLGIRAQSLKSNAALTSLPSPHLLVVSAGVCTASLLGELPLGS